MYTERSEVYVTKTSYGNNISIKYYIGTILRQSLRIIVYSFCDVNISDRASYYYHCDIICYVKRSLVWMKLVPI